MDSLVRSVNTCICSRHRESMSSIRTLISVIFMHTAFSFEIPVCCPHGFKFVESSRGLFRASRFECVPVISEYSDSSSFPLIYGYNIRESNRSEIPACWDPTLIKISEQVPLTSESCIFELDGDFHAITCQGRDMNIVSVINKCCPFGQSYDFVEKMCVESNLTTEVFNKILDHSVIFTNSSFNCRESGVIVDYFSERHGFTFDGGHLVIGDAKESFSSSLFCIEAILNSTKNSSNAKETFIARTCNSPLICNRIPCIRRCCNDRQKYMQINGMSTCMPHPVDHSIVFHKYNPNEKITDNTFRPQQIEPREYGMLRGQTCEKYRLDPTEAVEDSHYFHYDDGSIHLPWEEGTYENSEYCVEFVHTPSGVEPFTFLCFEDSDADKVKFGLYPIGLLISCGFAATTLIVYLCVPKLRNLPGKILVCLVLSLLVAYLVTAIGQIYPAEDKVCHPFAFSIYFSLMAAFSWMNVMCFDIWITFSSSGRSPRLWKSQEKRRFLYYSLYGWGLPILLTTTLIILDKFQILPKIFRLKFGGGRCWFENMNVAPHLLFFLGPIGILIFCNFVFFLLTLKYCNKVKREIDRMQSSNSDKPVLRKRLGVNKAIFMMNLKLFVVMGASWVLEIISTAFYDRKHAFVWVVSDFYNALQGVLVFLIFVFKWKVWYLILDRLGIKHNHYYKRSGGTLATTAMSLSGSTNLLRMKSMENCCTTLLNQKVSMVPQGPNK